MKISAVAVAMLTAIGIMVASGCGKALKVDSDNTKDSKKAKEDRPAVPESPPYAKAVFDEVSHDFGIMEVGQSGSHTFTVTNKSDKRELLLKKGPTTCKCTLSNLKDGALAPGESTKIELTWKIPQGGDQFSQTAQIWTSDPENKTIVLSVTGHVRKAIEIFPPDEWRVGTVDDSKPGEFTAMVTSEAFDKFKILQIKSSSPTITATHRLMTAEELGTTRAKTGYKVNLVIKPGGMVGSLKETVTMQIELPDVENGGTKVSDFEVRVLGSVTGAIILRALPGVNWLSNAMVVRLGQFPATEGKSASLLLYVIEEEGKPFKITKVTADPPFLKAKLERVGDAKQKPKKGERSAFRLTLSVPPNSPPMSRLLKNTGVVHLETTHPKSNKVKIGVEFHSN